MAAEYEVNIKLNTKSVEQQLKNIDTRTKRTGRMATENINALVKAQDKRARLMNKINELEAKGLNVARLRKQMGQATNELAKRRFGSLQQEFRVLERNVRLEESKLRIMRSQAIAARDRAKFLAGASVGRGQFGPAAPSVQGPRQMIASPIGGATNIPGSPAFLRRQERIKMLEQVGLGAGFPLLFGGGAGSVIGGGLGGLTGSFGAQIAFSAIGQQIDRFIAGVASVGTALTSASGTVEMFREKNLFSSDAVKEHAFQLEEQGKMQELATLLAKDLASQIGTNAVESFQSLGGEVKEFLDTINHLFVAVGGFVAGPLAKLLNAINTVLGGVSTEVEFASLRRSLTGDAAAQFEAILSETRGTRALTGREKQNALRRGTSTDPVEGRLTNAVKQAVLDDPRIAKLRQTINITGQTTLDDKLGFQPPKNTEAEKAKREEARIQKRLKMLEQERKKIVAISGFKDKIAAAEIAGDKQLVVRLRGEQEIAEIESKRKQDLIDITDQRLIDAINAEAAAQVVAAQRDTERELIDLQRQKDQDRMDSMKKLIEQQYELNEAVKRQLALADGIAQIMGKGMAESFELLINGANNWGAALKDISANVLRDIARQLIQIYVIEQAVGFLRNFLTPFDPSTPLGAGGGQVGNYGTFGPNYGISQRQLGGPVGARQPYLVGERGPELFVPGAQGNIVPNNAMGGANIVVNVDASGSQAQGNEPNAKALGSAIGAAVQAELIKQKRPGGLLS